MLAGLFANSFTHSPSRSLSLSHSLAKCYVLVCPVWIAYIIVPFVIKRFKSVSFQVDVPINRILCVISLSFSRLLFFHSTCCLQLDLFVPLIFFPSDPFYRHIRLHDFIFHSFHVRSNPYSSNDFWIKWNKMTWNNANGMESIMKNGIQ